MITRFHATGASAGIEKRSNVLSIPTVTPLSASRRTSGNITCDRPTMSDSSSGWSSKPGANRGMIHGASRMNSSVTPPRTTVISESSALATLNASFLRPFSSSSAKTGTNAPWSAASANSARIRFGTWNAIVNADIAPVTPK